MDGGFFTAGFAGRLDKFLQTAREPAARGPACKEVETLIGLRLCAMGGVREKNGEKILWTMPILLPDLLNLWIYFGKLL
ncbi:hypothetical protein DWV16_09370 [Anaerotruncus sp. AF02-27]|uniref:hypothetical protein n=1 Tax=Anaerotruncus TaxID=244127 RepID=UPI000E49C711|nr:MULTISPECIES: hypothetical protein [Anaerotruncus]RGX55418.1 hypothetical protein DWV16_09370 [Anaerotruncus sp. AF02-27]